MKLYFRYLFQLCSILLLGSLLSSWCMAPRSVYDGPIKTLIIDAGHGGKDPGAVGKQYYEKDIVLKVALELRDILAEQWPEMPVHLTRDDDTFIELHKRAELAQEHGGNFFLSIHCNGLKDTRRYGTESYILGINKGQENYARIIAENQAILFEEDHSEMYGGFDPSSPEGFIYFRLLKNAFRQESFLMAEKIQSAYTDQLGRKDRGVKQAPFIVLYESGMPAVLTEMGFISNEKEEIFLGSETGQKYLASALFQAIKAYQIGEDIAKDRP